MSTTLPKYAPLFLLLASVAAASCGGAAERITEPAAATADAARTSLAVQPQSLRPEFLHDGSCVGGRPFGARFKLVIRGHRDLILRGLRFSFIDRLGATTAPDVIPVPSLSTPAGSASTLPSSSPIPVPGIAALPGASSIPIPGAGDVHGIFVSAGASRVLPFFARFGCGVVADGTLVIIADVGNRSGRFEASEVRVRVGP